MSRLRALLDQWRRTRYPTGWGSRHTTAAVLQTGGYGRCTCHNHHTRCALTRPARRLARCLPCQNLCPPDGTR